MIKIAIFALCIMSLASCEYSQSRTYSLSIKNVDHEIIDNVIVKINDKSFDFGFCSNNSSIYPVSADLTKNITVEYTYNGKRYNQKLEIDDNLKSEINGIDFEFVILFSEGIPQVRIVKTLQKGLKFDQFEFPCETKPDFIRYKKLIVAVKDGKINEVQELVRNQTPLTYISAVFLTPIEYSVIHNKIEIFQYLYRKMNGKISDKLINSCLHLSAQDANMEIFNVIWSITTVDNRKRFATNNEIMHIAESRGGNHQERTSIIKRIIEDCDLNATRIVSDYGHTPIFFAANENNIPLMRLMINKGVDVNAKIKSGETVLSWANGMSKETRIFLIENGAK